MKRLIPLALTATLLATTGSAHALFGDDQARRQISELREEFNVRFERLENLSRGQLEFANQNELLRAELASLRGQIEVLVHELDLLKQRQRDFYVDLDTRLRQLETGAPSAAQAADPEAEARDYEAALNLLKDGKNKEALAAFEQFITHHLSSGMLPNANFWAGNAALQAKEVAAARNYFTTVINTWPDDAVAPDAMLGLANSQQAMGEARLAQETLNRILQRYPDSSAAQVASQRLGTRR